MKAHFAGICGVGMGATAMLLKQNGWEVTGSDAGCHPPMSDYLAKQKIAVAQDYDEANITSSVELVVAGGNAKLKLGENVELNKARELGIPVKTFPEILGEVTADTKNILAVGSYGKSTCATLLAWSLHHARKDPSYFIGALPIGLDTPGHRGTSDTFVLEGDEYPTSSIDPRPKFLHIRPHTVLLISADHDHVNIYPTIESYLKPFAELLANVPSDGRIVACLDNQNVDTLIAPHLDKTITYGLNAKNDPLWSAQNIVRGKETIFDMTKDGSVICSITTSLLGDHNIQNILGTGALLLENGLLTPTEFADAMRAFKGLTRRLDLKTEKSSVLLYEGFGSSREKARAAISAVVTHFPERRTIVLFEPHTFSWRNRGMLHWYDDVFEGCDHVFIYKPPEVTGPAAHEGEGKYKDDQLTQADIVEQVQKAGIAVTPVTSGDHTIELLKDFLRPDDLVLIMTSSHFDGLIEKLPAKLDEWFPV